MQLALTHHHALKDSIEWRVSFVEVDGAFHDSMSSLIATHRPGWDVTKLQGNQRGLVCSYGLAFEFNWNMGSLKLWQPNKAIITIFHSSGGNRRPEPPP
jgi:hypothetical protein